MEKILIHTIKVEKVGAKLQFQIKLPRVIRLRNSTNLINEKIGVKELLVTHIPLSGVKKRGKEIAIEKPTPVEFLPIEDIPTANTHEIGWLWLRIPEERDVFYCETIRPSIRNGANRSIDNFLVPPRGISTKGDWWLNGTKQEYFKVDVLTNRTIIEGFYVDRTKGEIANYEIRIYLKLKLPKTK